MKWNIYCAWLTYYTKAERITHIDIIHNRKFHYEKPYF